MLFMRYVYSLVVVVYFFAKNGQLEAAPITVADATLKIVDKEELRALQRALNGKRFDDLSDSRDGVSWKLSDIHIQDLGTMTSGIKLLYNGQIKWTCVITSITLKADWWARWRGWLGSISSDGSVKAKVRRTSLSVALTLSEHSGGLGISLSSCSASVGSFNLHFSGSLLSWLLNTISNVFERDIKRSLADSICDLVKKGVKDIKY